MVVVAAVDRTDRSVAVMREATALAEAFDEPVHVVHVMTTGQFVDMGMTKAQSEEHVDMDEVREVAAEVAEDATADLDRPHEAVGLVGQPANRVVQYANERDARYIVVAGRKRSPAGKAIFGSVSQSILLNAECAVVSTMAADE